MTYEEFNKMERREKLLFVYHKAHEIDSIFPWIGTVRIVTIYKLFDFIVEIECNLEGENMGITYVIGHNSYDILLEKYPPSF